MQEMLLAGNISAQPPEQEGIFLFDHGQRKDLINNNATVVVNGATVDNVYLIDGHPTTKLNATNNYLYITLPNPINMDTGDWTFEYSVINTSFIAAQYEGEITGMTNTNQFLVARWTDSGYGYMLQHIVGTAGASDEPNMWRIAESKFTITNQLRRMAWVCKGGIVTIFKNGIPVKVRNWNDVGNISKVEVKDNFPRRSPVGNLNRIHLGWLGASNFASPSNIGRIRISDYARYTGAYTPQPF